MGKLDKNVKVLGRGNYVDPSATNVLIVGNNNSVQGNLNNVQITGDGYTVTESNKIIVDGSLEVYNSAAQGTYIRDVSASEYISADYSLFNVDTTAGDVTLYFGSLGPKRYPGMEFTFWKKVQANNIILQPTIQTYHRGGYTVFTTAQTINGASSLTIQNKNSGVNLRYDGYNNWMIV